MVRSFLFLATASMALADTPGPLRQLQPKIVGGAAATLGDYPTYVTPTAVDAAMETRCGGIMIAADLFLTAASCDIYTPTRPVAIGGITAGGGDASDILRVAETYPHREFNSVTSEYDVMIVRLNGRASVTPSVRDTSALPTMGTVIGYGGSPGTPSTVLEDVTVPIGGTGCASVDDAVQLCAGTTTAGVCSGDHGGPLLNSATNGIIGIATFSTATCDTPQIYTRTDAFALWMEILICNNSLYPVTTVTCPTFTPAPAPTDPVIVPGSCYGGFACELYLVALGALTAIGFLAITAVGFFRNGD